MAKPRVDIHEAACKAMEHDPEVLAAIGRDIVPRVVAAMQRRAPRDTGAGAASIHGEPDADGWRVSWDEAHYYMWFHEVGTQKMPARPFVRPTIDEFNGR